VKRGIIPGQLIVILFLGICIFENTQAFASDIAGTQTFCDVHHFGAVGRRSQDATSAFRRAVETCARRGGGIVYVGPGAYVSGPIELRDNITLYLDAGATLYLNPDTVIPDGQPDALVYSRGAKNISISGKGTLDGQAKYKWAIPEGEDSEISEETALARAAGEDMRRSIHVGNWSHVIWIQGSTNVHINDVSIVNSADWSVRVDDSERVFVEGVYIYSSLTMGVNGDGIDLVSSRDVSISDSVITTGDDSIVLKTIPVNGVVKPTENVTVTNCILTSSSTPLMIGTETFADIRHVVFSNIVIRNSNKGFGINVQDGATVSDILVSDVTMELNRRHWNWWGSAEVFKIVLKRRTPTSRIGAIKNVVLDNIVSHTRGTSLLEGLPEHPLDNIRISRLQMFMEPENAPDKRATDALHAENVTGLHLDDVDVSWDIEHTEPLWKSALSLKHVTDFFISNFSGCQAPRSTFPAISLDQTRDGVVRNSMAKEGCDTFVAISGQDSQTIRLADNDASRARRAVIYPDKTVSSAGTACMKCQ
jgi:hypothetical protein